MAKRFCYYSYLIISHINNVMIPQFLKYLVLPMIAANILIRKNGNL